jgi:excisionase family DNA binding protein
MNKLTVTQLSFKEIKQLIHKEVKKLVREEVAKALTKASASNNAATTNNNGNKTKTAYSVEEAAEILGLSKAFLRNEIRDGNLKIQRFGRRVLILSQDFQNYTQNGSTRI